MHSNYQRVPEFLKSKDEGEVWKRQKGKRNNKTYRTKHNASSKGFRNHHILATITTTADHVNHLSQ